MPVVPNEDDLGYAPVSALPQTQSQPADFGAQAFQATQQLGQQGMESAKQVGNIALQQEQITQQAQSVTNFHTLQQAAQTTNFGDPSDPSNPGFFGLKGKDAVAAYPTAMSKLNDLQAKLSAQLAPQARMDFEQSSRRFLDSNFQSMGQHYLQQNNAYLAGAAQSTVEGNANLAASYYNDPAKINTALASSQQTIVAEGQRSGASPETINQQIADNRSKTYSAVIERQAQDNPLQAWNFYQAHQTLIGGLDQAAIEQRLTSQINTWKSKIDADNIIAGGAGQTAVNVTASAQKQSVDPTYALTSTKLESGMGRNLQNPNSSASGVLQLTNATWAAQGGTAANRGDPIAQADLGVKNLGQSLDAASAALGHTADPWQGYLVHQQGAGGGPALLKADPNANAVQVLTPVYGNANSARMAIVNNGGTAGMSAGQFLASVQGKYQAASSTVSLPPATVPGAPAPGVPTSTNPADHVATWLAQADGLPDFKGNQNPEYQSLVEARIKQRVGEIEYGQAQTDRQAKSTLLSAAMGVPDPNAVLLPGAGSAASSKSAAPTSLDTLLATPAAKAAWMSATPETQRSINEIIRTNATQGPPITDGSVQQYYALRSQSVTDPAGFLKVNLADPDLISTMPRDYLHQLMGIQAGVDRKTAADAERQTSMAHAREVVMPDLLAAGINPTQARTNTTTAATYAAFDGRLDEALQKFQATNGKRPNDDQIKSIGQTLLTPGYLHGTGSLWGALPNDTSTKLFQAQTAGTTGQFYPAVPAADRKGIIAAYQAKHGAAPSDAQIQSYFMMGRQKPAGAPAYTPARSAPLLPPVKIDGPSPAPARSAQAAPAVPQLADASGF